MLKDVLLGKLEAKIEILNYLITFVKLTIWTQGIEGNG